MSLHLKSTADITSLINGSDFASITTDIKTQLANHFIQMPESVREAALGIEVTVLPSAQANFCRALFTDAPAGPSDPIVTPAVVNADRRLSSLADIIALDTTGYAEAKDIVVSCIDEGRLKFFQFAIGTDLHNPAAGILRAGDYTSSRNHIWKEIL